jgi:hypothetical protein
VIESGQPFDIRWSGAYGNGLNDDTQAMVNAFSMMQNTIQGTPPTSFPDLYGKIGNTIFFPAGSYVINEGASFTFYGKAVGHQYFNPNSTTNPTLSSSFIVDTVDDVSFVSQEFRNLNIEGSSNSIISVNAVNVSGCYFTAPITISPIANPYPQTNAPTSPPLGGVTIQGCQFLTNGSCLNINNSDFSPNILQVIINGSVFQGGIEVSTDLSDLVINDCYYLNSSGSYVPGIPHVSVSSSAYSISAMSPSVKAITLTEGTTYTNPSYLMTATIRIPVLLSATSKEPAEVNVGITDQYGNRTSTIMAAASTGLADIGFRQTITFDVPPQASYTVTATNATLEEGTISYNTTAVSLSATSVSLQ